MRDAYHEELAAVTDQLVAMARLVGQAMSRATEALLSCDLSGAEQVIDGDAAVDALRENIDRRAVDLIARQQPVASDLRSLTTALRMTSDLERAGDLATHVARLTRRRYPTCAVPPQLEDTIRHMGSTAVHMVDKASDAIASRDASMAAQLESDDDEMDALHRQLLLTVLAPDWDSGVDTAIDLALAGRYYERFADHVVSAARQVTYLVTGALTTRGGVA